MEKPERFCGKRALEEERQQGRARASLARGLLSQREAEDVGGAFRTARGHAAGRRSASRSRGRSSAGR